MDVIDIAHEGREGEGEGGRAGEGEGESEEERERKGGRGREDIIRTGGAGAAGAASPLFSQVFLLT